MGECGFHPKSWLSEFSGLGLSHASPFANTTAFAEKQAEKFGPKSVPLWGGWLQEPQDWAATAAGAEAGGSLLVMCPCR